MVTIREEGDTECYGSTYLITILLQYLGEDVVLIFPIERNTEEGTSVEWAQIGNLNMWKWLTTEDVYTLNNLYKTTGDLALLLEKTYAQLLVTDGALREMVSSEMKFQISRFLVIPNFHRIN